MAVNNLIILRKGTASQWNSANPVLASGEPGYDLTNQILKVGDGVTAWNSLSNHSHTASNISDFNISVSGLVNGIYAPLSSPTFTGTVNGISKSMVGLGNVDNTSDANKPVSTATQTALDGKAALSHTHTSSNITDFNSSVSGLLPVKNITPSSYIDIVSSTGNFTISVTGLQPAGSYAAATHSHSISDVTGLQTSLDGKQASGSYAASSHTHTASNITDFNSSVSGLLPVTSIIAGTNITIGVSAGAYTINSTASGGGGSSDIDAGTYPLITISSQPSATSVSESSSATFSVTAAATFPTSSITYQWQESTNNSTWSNISGSTSSTLTLTNVQSGKNGYYYRCNLQSLLSNIFSNSAILTVTAATTTTTTTAAPTTTTTTTTTTTAAPSSFITLAYTAGSWSGAGTSASKYTTSSTFSPRPAGASSELLPFNFTATSDCEFYLKWSHYGANDDNYRPQTTQILINGNPIDTDRIASTETQIQGLISNSVEYPVWLTTGDVVTVRVYREDTSNGLIDTYTSVSAYAVARTTSPMTLIKQGGGSPSWSGIGTVDSKYVRAGSTEIYNINFNTGSIIFTVKKSGTFYYTGTVSDYPDDNFAVVYLSKNGASPLIGDSFFEGQTGTRSKAVSVGDIITLYSGGNSQPNTNYVSNISAWVE